MTKAVIIIDIPKAIEKKYSGKEIIVQLWNKEEEHYIMHDICELKPMPERKVVETEINTIDDYMNCDIQSVINGINAQISLDTELLLATGYNCCIDEILGNAERK